MGKVIGFLIIGLILIAAVSYVVRLFNRLVFLKNQVAKTFANIDVLLKQRADEVPNLVLLVKEAMRHEKDLLESLTEMRSQFLRTTLPDGRITLSNDMQRTVQAIFVLSENYPDLQSNQNLLQLQARITELENHLADRREFYNESVNMYNTGIAEFPNLILSKLLGYKPMHMLSVSEKEADSYGVRF